MIRDEFGMDILAHPQFGDPIGVPDLIGEILLSC